MLYKIFLCLVVFFATACFANAFPNGLQWEYQIGGSFTPSKNTKIVTRDRRDKPAPGLYNICYINGFQIQPSELAWWKKHHPNLILKKRGKIVIDKYWNEAILDIRTEKKQKAIGKVVNRWLKGCEQSGFQAVEIDNLDSFQRSKKQINQKQAVSMAKKFVKYAKKQKLDIGQKNTAEIIGKVDFDFAVVEQCQEYDECSQFYKQYNNRVLEVEYNRKSFEQACKANPRQSILFREQNVSTPGSKKFKQEWCRVDIV